MKPQFNWSLIRSGATFHALVNILLLLEDPDTHVFTKEGADGAFDAVSPKWDRAYQAKYHSDPNSSRAFADAKKELAKIKKYRKAKHKHYDLWKGIKQWVLITNVPFGTKEAKKWDAEIKPLFKALKIKATWMTRSALEKQLAQHPAVAQSFFEGRTRSFISLPEFGEEAAEAGLEGAFAAPLRGRDAATARVRKFLAEPTTRLLVVHGPGGVGKTRFLYEAGLLASREGFASIVYKATRAGESSNDWYSGIVAEAPAVVLVDEPRDPKFIDVLIEQLRGRANRWKVIVAVRSPNHPVLRILKDPRLVMVSQPALELNPLVQVDAERLARALLDDHLGKKRARRGELVSWLVHVSGGIPIWIALGVRLLKDRGHQGDLPSDRWAVAAGYFDEILHRGPADGAAPAELRTLLRWIALLQPIVWTDSVGVEFLRCEAGFVSDGDLERAVASLHQRRVISRYGIDDRRVEIPPDVMRDFIVRDWLTLLQNPDDVTGARVASPEAAALVARIVSTAVGADQIPALGKSVQMLGRLEREVQPPLRLLDPLVAAVQQAAKEAPDAAAQLRALEVAEAFAAFRPMEFCQIVGLLRRSDVPSGYIPLPGFAKGFERTREDVVMKLAWSLFSVAAYADGRERASLLDEMLALVDAEAAYVAGRARANDGKRAEALVRRLFGEDAHIVTFASESEAVADRLLDDLTADRVVSTRQIETLLRSLLSVHRNETQWTRDQITIVDKVLIPGKGPANTVVRLRDRLWSILGSVHSPESSKSLAWKILHEHHATANVYRPRGSVQPTYSGPDWTPIVRENLERVRDFVKRSSPSLNDWFGARELWDWHAQHDDDPSLRELANELEQLFRSDASRGALAALFLNDEVADLPNLSAQARVLRGELASTITSFLSSATEFLTAPSHAWRRQKLVGIVWEMGADAAGFPENLREYVATAVSAGLGHPQRALALTMFGGRLQRLRTDLRDAELATELQWILQLDTSASAQRDLLREIYIATPFMLAQRSLRAADAAVVKKHHGVFADTPVEQANLLGIAFTVAPESLRSLADELFRSTVDQDPFGLIGVLTAFCRGLLPATLGAKTAVLSDDDYAWLIATAARLPRLTKLENIGQLGSISKLHPRFDVAWLAGLLEERARTLQPLLAEPQDTFVLEGRPRIVSRDFPFVRLVAPLSATRVISNDDVNAFERMLDLYAQDPSLTWHELPHIIVTLDPDGGLVPSLIVKRLRSISEVTCEEIRVWSQFAARYTVGCASWRTIASVACDLAEAKLTDKDLESIWSSLRSRDTGVLTGAIGEVHEHWSDAARHAAEQSGAEAAGPLKRFFEWRAREADQALTHEVERLEEED